ncbi:hypothetical protein ACFSTE_13300 [Aquimarina hainanensis]|uniref:Uncharacterized protein n=1 Tax=Aquimarina hainanensis TaxID=1578017 RepID=A0ABW5N9T1_9FLAO
MSEIDDIISEIDDIINGWKNYLTSDELIIEQAKERALICLGCVDEKGKKSLKWGLHAAILPDYTLSEIKGYYCKICKCPASVVVRSKNHKCPQGKW